MQLEEVIESVSAQILAHVEAKGYGPGPGINPLAPQDCVTAFAMAKHITEGRPFDHYVSIDPEGHVYGYFFEQLGVPVLSVFVDYPPTRFEEIDDLSPIEGGRVLLIEDDVISGTSLRLTVQGLARHSPKSMSLYLGREKEFQLVENVPSEIVPVYLSEEQLAPGLRSQYEREFLGFFG